MAQKPESLQDLIRNRQQSGFVGRVGQLAQYQENLGLSVNDERRRFLFNIHGDAGVGKTYLTRQLRQLAASSGALTAYVDETADDATAAMSAIATQLAQAGTKLGGFEKRAEAYRRRRHELESDPKAPEDIAAFLTKTAVTIGLAAARDIPVAGSLLAPVDPGAAADQVNRARAYLARRLGDHADVRLLLSPADELTPVFVAELNRVAGTRPIALFIDTYERTGLVLDHWLGRLYEGRYRGLPVTLVTTISGQKPLDPNLWGDYLPVIADIALEPFSDAEARQFLTSKGIGGEDLIQVILSLSGRLPLWLATLAEARPARITDIGDPAGDAVERFLKWESDPARRRVAMAAALPRTLNQDVLAEVAGTGEAHELFGWLCMLPFLSRREGSWAYHEVVRAAMLRLQQAQAPNEWIARQLALAEAHERWALDAAGDDDDGWSSPRFIDHAREWAYHLLCAKPDANLHGALTSAVKAAEHSTVRARQWAALIADAGKDTDDPQVRRWGRRLLDGIQDDDVTGYLTSLINDAGLDKSTLSIALDQRGEGHRLAGRYDVALADFNRAIELDPEDAWAIASRGQTFRDMRRYDEALADLNRAIELNLDLDWAIVDRGATLQLMDRHPEALADLNRAIELNPSNDSVFISRGLTFQAMGRYSEALADFNRAIELNPEYDWAIGSRGETFRRMKRYDEALADLNRAIEVSPEHDWPVLQRSLIFRDMKRYGEALSDLNRAIELDPSSALAIASRGETFLEMTRYDEAVADFNRAIELDPSNDWAIARRGDTFRLMHHQEEALADLNRAIELDPEYDWAIGSRGATFRDMRRYDEALADFNRAIELDPEYTWAIAQRGATFRDMRRYDEALADFNRAIELDPEYDWAIGSRSETFRDMRRYDEALADFNRAIELDPELFWAIGSRGEILRDMRRYDEALADFNRAIELDPGSALAIASRGETFVEMKRYDEALADFNRAIELDPGSVLAIGSRGETFRRMKRYDEALADFNRAIELDPGSVLAIGSRGETFRDMRRYDEALADFNRAIELDPGSVLAIGSRGETFRDMRRYDEALADLNRAIELDPELDWAIASRGETFRRMKRYDEALADLNRAIELNPDDDDYTTERAEIHRLSRHTDEPTVLQLCSSGLVAFA